MNQTDFHLGCDVTALGGRRVGRLHRLLVDGDTFRVTGLVLQEDRSFSGHTLAPGAALITDDLVVPVEAIAQVSHQEVRLKLRPDQVRRLRPYLTTHFEPAGSGHDVAGSIEAWVLRPLSVLGGVVVPPAIETADKPEGTFEIDLGEELWGAGRSLGQVEDVLLEEGELVGVVLRPDGFFKKAVIVPRRLLDRGDDRRLEARLGPQDLEFLVPFVPSED